MRIEVQLFARLRELAGADRLLLELPEQATVFDLRGSLMEALPHAGRLIEHCAIAIDDEWADDLTKLSAGNEIAVLPPVSGGTRT